MSTPPSVFRLRPTHQKMSVSVGVRLGVALGLLGAIWFGVLVRLFHAVVHVSSSGERALWQALLWVAGYAPLALLLQFLTRRRCILRDGEFVIRGFRDERRVSYGDIDKVDERTLPEDVIVVLLRSGEAFEIPTQGRYDSKHCALRDELRRRAG